MTTFNFTSPDGQKYSVNGPDGATVAQAFDVLQQQLSSQGHEKSAGRATGAATGGDDWWKNAPLVKPAPAAGDDWWRSAPVVKREDRTTRGPWENYAPRQEEDGPWTKYQAASPEKEKPTGMPWGEVGSQAIQNAPASAGRFIEGIAQPFIHPIDTAKALSNVGTGAIAMGGSALAASMPSETLPEATFGERYQHGLDIVKKKSGADETYPKAVGQLFKEKYGSVENLKRTLATDPVGVAADLSMLFTGGETALARAPGIAGKVGEAAGTVGRAMNPIGAVGNVAKGIGYGASELVGGLGTHTGGESLRLAANAGYEGGEAAKAFRENLRGAAPMEEVVNDARSALGKIRQERGEAYRTGMVGVASDPTILPFDSIDKAIKQAGVIKTYKGQSLSPSTAAISEKIADAVNDWRGLDPKEFHTVEGLDALKQKIGDIRDATQYGTPERFAADRVYQSVRKTIIEQAPEYAKVMKGYELASKEIKEIERTLSLNPNASVDTSLRKLQSVLRDNVNTSYGQRRVLADYLKNAGAPNLMERLAGQVLKPWTARGLGKLGMELVAALGAGAGAGAVGGASGAALGAVAALPLMSPRLMGEAAYLGGRAASPLKNIPITAAQGNAAFQAGRIGRTAQSAVEDYASKRLSVSLSPEDAGALDAALKSGGLLADQVRAPLAKWGQASVAFRGSPSPKTKAQLSLAARNLANNLATAGINLSPDLLVEAAQ
jgi:hypothetical protein